MSNTPEMEWQKNIRDKGYFAGGEPARLARSVFPDSLKEVFALDTANVLNEYQVANYLLNFGAYAVEYAQAEKEKALRLFAEEVERVAKRVWNEDDYGDWQDAYKEALRRCLARALGESVTNE